MIRKWSFRAALFLSALTLLCWVDFLALIYLEESDFRSEEGGEYCPAGSPSLPLLIAGVYAAFGAVMFLVMSGLLLAYDYVMKIKKQVS